MILLLYGYAVMWLVAGYFVLLGSRRGLRFWSWTGCIWLSPVAAILLWGILAVIAPSIDQGPTSSDALGGKGFAIQFASTLCLMVYIGIAVPASLVASTVALVAPPRPPNPAVSRPGQRGLDAELLSPNEAQRRAQWAKNVRHRRSVTCTCPSEFRDGGSAT